MRNTLRVFFCVITIVNIIENEASCKVTMFRDKILHGCTFQKTSETTVENCLARCLENCACRSFQMCGEDKTCSLCLSYNSSMVIEDKKGSCGYFALERSHAQNGLAVKTSCLQDTNCCLTSQPCRNNGLCKPSYPSDILHSPRFQCDCAPGYHGNRCEQPMKSCRGYINGNSVPASGKYTIIDDKNQPFQVFCDFISSPGNPDFDAMTSWTLIQSYQFKNRDNFQNPFYTDRPQNATTPNWKWYRLSKSRMESIQRDSSKWRMTCRYETDALNYTDYVEGLKTEVDILSFNRTACKKVEFINVRGYNCTLCEAMMKQKRKRPFHHDSSYNSKCEFKPKDSKDCTKKENNNGEDYFGRYKCVNKAHRCSMDDLSTTQTWLGSRVEHA